ncbi:hypothetical protein JX134_003528 [Escherichia coli]|nr:hypothetical protein [Escherichia coli]
MNHQDELPLAKVSEVDEAKRQWLQGMRHLWGSDQFWAEFVQPGRTCKPCVARGVVI